MAQAPDIRPLSAYLLDLQDRLCRALEDEDGAGRFAGQPLPGERGGLARPRTLAAGEVFEKAAVNFSHTAGARLPAAAAARRPELGRAIFEAVSVSAVIHPANPYVPAAHLNLRLFQALGADGEAVWWLGGGFDLSPCYGFEEDAVHWHKTARAACEPFGGGLYRRFKKRCDEYFYLPHRGEGRGVGGIVFDDLREPDFATCSAFARSVGDHFLPAYLPIVGRRKATPYGERQRSFQLFRRGRYAEFNLLYDRGTRFGLEAGVRADSVLASLPPVAAWPDGWTAEPGSPEGRLGEEFLAPRDWLGEDPQA